MHFFKSLRHTLALPLFAVLLCGCIKDGPEKKPFDNISAVIDNPATKVSGKEDGSNISQTWEVGDIIYGYNGKPSNTVKYSVSSVSDGKASFVWAGSGNAPTVSDVSGKTFHMVCDGTNPSDMPADGIFPVDLRSQSGTLDDAVGRTCMAASGTVAGNALELTFSNLTALLKITPDEGFSIRGISSAYGLTPTGSLSVSDGKMTFTPGSKDDISITGSTSGTTVYVAIPATTIIGLEVWESNGSSEKVARSTSAQTAAASKCYTFSKPFEPRFHNSLPGLFSISGSEQISFAKGNLQYNPSGDAWRFAPNQFDVIGSGNANVSSTYDGWIDLFGWGTTGEEYTSPLSSPDALAPWSTSATDSSYGPAYTSASEHYSYNYLNPGWNSDWGCHFSGFRTLSDEEWDYLLFRETTLLYGGYATVCEVKGIILIPDSFVDPQKNGGDKAFVYDNGTYDYTDNSYDEQGWAYMEIAEAVFLPCTGWRIEEDYNSPGLLGQYWSNTGIAGGKAVEMSFDSESIGVEYAAPRSHGLPVRLVCY